jgi:aminoglycoside phosphotransferase (APT) family kinase protein
LASATRLLAERSTVDPVLLHMDLRPANLCVRDGQIVAVLDVANALAGDPLFELARIRNYGLLTDSFCAGYGLSAGQLRDVGSVVDLYELETAALLTVVAVEEIDDETLHTSSRARLRDLGTLVLRSR